MCTRMNSAMSVTEDVSAPAGESETISNRSTGGSSSVV